MLARKLLPSNLPARTVISKPYLPANNRRPLDLHLLFFQVPSLFSFIIYHITCITYLIEAPNLPFTEELHRYCYLVVTFKDAMRFVFVYICRNKTVAHLKLSKRKFSVICCLQSFNAIRCVHVKEIYSLSYCFRFIFVVMSPGQHDNIEFRSNNQVRFQ